MAVPFVVTIVVSLLFTTYLLVDPGIGLSQFMQLTWLSFSFKIFLLVLTVVGFVAAWLAEKHVFLWLAGAIGRLHDCMWPYRRKKRKAYKVLKENMKL